MNAVNKLLDKAKQTCSMSSDAALAERVEVSRQQLSRWRKGHDSMPDDQIARIARIANSDAGEWLVLIESEQAKGEAKKAYGSLVRRLGIAALLAMLATTSQAAENGHSGQRSTSQSLPVLPIMSTIRH